MPRAYGKDVVRNWPPFHDNARASASLGSTRLGESSCDWITHRQYRGNGPDYVSARRVCLSVRRVLGEDAEHDTGIRRGECAP